MSVFLTPVAIMASNPQGLAKVYVDRRNPEKEGTYFLRLLLTAKNLEEKAWKDIEDALLVKAKEKFGPKAAAMMKEGAIRTPLRRDMSAQNYDELPFEAFLNLNAYADRKPALVDVDGRMLSDFALLETGCRIRASVFITTYDVQGNKGVNLKLRGVQYAGPKPAGLVIPTKGGGDGSGDFGELPTASADDLDSLLG